MRRGTQQSSSSRTATGSMVNCHRNDGWTIFTLGTTSVHCDPSLGMQGQTNSTSVSGVDLHSIRIIFSERTAHPGIFITGRIRSTRTAQPRRSYRWLSSRIWIQGISPRGIRIAVDDEAHVGRSRVFLLPFAADVQDKNVVHEMDTGVDVL